MTVVLPFVSKMTEIRVTYFIGDDALAVIHRAEMRNHFSKKLELVFFVAMSFLVVLVRCRKWEDCLCEPLEGSVSLWLNKSYHARSGAGPLTKTHKNFQQTHQASEESSEMEQKLQVRYNLGALS